MKQKDGHKHMLVEEYVATNYCQNDQPAKVKVQNDLAGDIDWSESDYSEIEEIITEDISEEIKETDEEEEVEEKTDIESDERTVRNVIRSECDDDKSGKANMKKGMVDKDNTDNNVEKEKTTQSNTKREEGERRTQEPDKNQPAKLKDSSIFSAGAEVKQTQCKDVSLVAAAESKTLNPQEDQPANYLSVFAAAGGKTQDSAKVKGEKDLDINVDWSETDYSCSDDEFMSEEIYRTDEEKGLLQLQTDGNTKEIGGETTDSDDFQRCRINSEKDEKDGYEKKEVIQENQRAKCKDFSIFSAGAQVTHSPCKGKNELG
ncbi:uncharacterized protein LOC129855029 [Salvelinus fontinalis]|uniref:uncharacterized protein LOC129855029 n=1 Tax=Salvelinus fontinalis TaxID=8038 RepID=UPI00248681AB|nr:uncharacterized protein LOC129855029 [Salvelinus fontinalis]